MVWGGAPWIDVVYTTLYTGANDTLHLPYIQGPPLHMYMHLPYIHGPPLHTCTSLTYMHLPYIHAPPLHTCTSLTYKDLPYICTCTSLTYMHLPYIHGPPLHTLDVQFGVLCGVVPECMVGVSMEWLLPVVCGEED